jgi:hypothetical protein
MRHVRTLASHIQFYNKNENLKIMFGKNKMIKNAFMLIAGSLLLLITAIESYGQSITWQKTYGGPFDWKEGAHALCEADSGNFYAVGYTFNESRIKKILYVLKLNQYGDTLWTKIIGNNYTLIGNAACSDGDGGCVITGDGDTSFVINLDRNGNIKWWKNYGINQVRAFDIVKTGDGGYVICGAKLSTSWFGYVLKIDSLGDLNWQNIYSAGDAKFFNSVCETNDNNIVAAGFVTDTFIDTQHVLLTKIDTSGYVLWEKRYLIEGMGGNANKITRFEGGFILAGTNELGRAFFIKVNSSGNKTFEKNFQSTRDESLWDFKVLASNRYVMTMMRDSSFFVLASRVIITDSLGNILHQKIFNPVGPAGYI